MANCCEVTVMMFCFFSAKKKISGLIIGITLVLLLTACAGNAEESSMTKMPTGYPADQVQNACVFFRGNLYCRGSYCEFSSEMKEVGQVTVVDNYNLPSEDYAAAHLEVGDKILILEAAGTVRLFVQIMAQNRLMEFYCVEGSDEKTDGDPQGIHSPSGA